MADFDRVRAEDLVKIYGITRALAGVTVELEARSVTVIEGPNGSGKSTLLSILSLQASPTRGQVRYGKLDATRHKVTLRARIGVLAHASMLYPDLTGRENLELFADLYGVEKAKAEIDRLIERFALSGFVDREARTYSRGQLQRVALARAVVHAPRFLLLDEPSTGLDAASTATLVKAIEEEKERGAIVAVVTHDAAFAERVGDRVIKLANGRVAEAPA